MLQDSTWEMQIGVSFLLLPRASQHMSVPCVAGWGLGPRSPVEREGEVAGGHKRPLQLEAEVVPREHQLGGSMAAGGGGVSLPQVVLLQNWLAGLLDSFPRPDPKDLTGLMEVVGDILHRLGTEGAGAFSLRIAQHLLPLFEDVRAPRLLSSAHQSEQRSCWPHPLSRGLWESPGGWNCPPRSGPPEKKVPRGLRGALLAQRPCWCGLGRRRGSGLSLERPSGPPRGE